MIIYGSTSSSKKWLFILLINVSHTIDPNNVYILVNLFRIKGENLNGNRDAAYGMSDGSMGLGGASSLSTLRCNFTQIAGIIISLWSQTFLHR